MNKVILIGRITKDPEIRYTPSGVPTVSFTLAVDRGMRDANGNRQADFLNCVAWRGQADFISRFIKKGFLMSVEGRIQTRNYQGQDGQTRYVTEIILDAVENLQPRDPNAQPYQPNQGMQQPQYQQNYQGYNNPSHGVPYTQATPTSQPDTEAPQSFNVDIADDDLPF
ncbi:MAG: single-stranded DNA-binding protein [Anaeroplasmataceae bacterium]|jgi:single stranded DNA-binding protein (ssb)|nr:single-stranded DNA-binding protein [Anaeroplasmataceae bacterium]